MSDIKTLKLKDEALINKLCDLGDLTIDKKRRWSIEFDDYGMADAIKTFEQHFIDKHCEVVNNVGLSADDNIAVIQAIRDTNVT